MPVMESEWGACLQTLEGHNGVTSKKILEQYHKEIEKQGQKA